MLLENLAELFLLIGWLLVTAGIAHLTAPVTWYFSLGLLALSLGGWKVLIGIALNGIGALSDGEARRG